MTQTLDSESLTTVAGDLLSTIRAELPAEDREDFAATVAHAIVHPGEGEAIGGLLSRWRRYAELMRLGQEEEAFDYRPWTPHSALMEIVAEGEADYAAGRAFSLG